MRPPIRPTRRVYVADAPPPRHPIADAQTEAVAGLYLSAKRGKPMRSGPRSLAQSVHKLLPDAVRKAGPGVRELQMRWSDVVGEKLAAVTQPDAIKGEALVLKVAAAAAPMVQMRSSEILGLVRLAGFDRLKKLSMVRAPLTKPPAATTKAKPLDALEKRQIEASLAGVDDEKLKAALYRLAAATHSL